MKRRPRKNLTRRSFLSTTGAAVGGAMLATTQTEISASDQSRLGNLYPGVASIVYDPNANVGSSGNLPVIRTMVDDGLMALTGESSPTASMSTLLTEGTTNKSVAIKVNCISSYVPTRWEMVRAIVERLIDAGIDPAYIDIFDNQDLSGNGFNSTNFPNGIGQQFDGLQFLSPGSCTYPVPGTTCNLCDRIVNADYLINAPVLKTHWGTTDQGFHFTLGMKNHYGSISGLTHTFPAAREMLGRISADPIHVRPKTILIALSAIFGYYTPNGPTGNPPLNWDTFGASSPKRVILSTDPITVDHIGIEMINHERVLHGLTEKTDEYVEYAATTFGLGIYNFASMTIHQWLGTPPFLSIADVGTDTRRLTWAYMNGAYGYRIYRSSNPYSGWSQVQEISDPDTLTWDDNTSIPQTGLYYRITAHNTFGESAPSQAAGAYSFPTT